MSSYPDTSPQATDSQAKRRPHVLYPQAYIWFVFLSAMDVCMTVMVLHWGGSEVNVLADAVIQRWGLAGMVTYKFVLVGVIVTICEVIGRRKRRVGKAVSVFAVVITAVPVVIAFVLLLGHVYGPMLAGMGR